MTEASRGVLDTSVLIDHDQITADQLPPLPFDAESARMYGRVFAAARAAGESGRARLADLLIASTAAANGLPLFTRNPSDFAALKRINKVVKV
jgi:predicted nucleic acid-binding protein